MNDFTSQLETNVNKRREVIEDTCHLVHSSQQMERCTLNLVCYDGHIALCCSVGPAVCC